MGKMRILDCTGDTVVEWQADDVVSVALAQEAFDQQRARRRLAFARPAGGAATEASLVRRFDASTEEIIWVRPVAGG